MTRTRTRPTPLTALAATGDGNHTGNARSATVSTAVGPFTAVAVDTEGGPAVIASGWTDDLAALMPQVAPSLRPVGVDEVAAIPGVTDRIEAYHDGDLLAIDAVAVRQDAGPFLELLWDTLREVAPGDPVTYTELAARAGRSRAARVAGSACSRNAAALFVPCHRVVPMGGGVGGFRWGPDVKRWLLRHEERIG